jgi:rhodanese-related sulfurtransferase
VKIEFIDPAALRHCFKTQEEIALVDVREEDTFADGHLLRASSLPFSRLELLARRLLPRLSLHVVVIADSEGLAEAAAARLTDGGYTFVSILKGGIAGWRAAGFPVYKGVHVPSKGFAEVIEHNNKTPSLTADEVAKRISEGSDLIILDSRSNEEYRDNTIPSAINVPGAELVYRIHDLVPSEKTTVIVNCGGRTRSIIGAQSLINAGIKNDVFSLKNGTMGWHLAGLQLQPGNDEKLAGVSREGVNLALQRARNVASAFGVKSISTSNLKALQAASDTITLYLFDVRTPEEFTAGHLEGFVNVSGGQLVQETDSWVASWKAMIVLADDNGVRATMTASWLLQQGYSNVFLIEEGIGRESLVRGITVDDDHHAFPLRGPEPKSLSADEVAKAIDEANAVVIDISLSSVYESGHIPGSWHAVRSRLTANIGNLPPWNLLIITSGDGVLARFCAAELAGIGLEVAVIAGGTQGWIASHKPLETGLVNVLDEPDDVHYVPRKRKKDQARYMREYLDWELALLHQLGDDCDCPFLVHSNEI